ncbi:MAG: alcohol dehydrogenase catalytic domain-containing protein [Candidatus Hydrogenedentes bacterium]|nr:alcohol dehydrogenase catalytic domain-containing protein [Candidatus Hydrogenedentota bacterium]
MKALYFDGEPRVIDLPVPRPAKGDALIRVLKAGICNTDLEIMKGYMAFRGVLGHEFVGVVEECENEFLRGKRVVGEINCVCHRCPTCRMELPHHCTNRTVLGIRGRNGTFAEFVTLPQENLHIVPDAVRDEIAVFTEPLAAAFRIPEQIEIADTDRIVVLGAGKLGQLIAQVLYTHSKNLLCIGKNEWKLEVLKNLRIPTAHVDEPRERGMADIVVDATGSYEGFPRALELVRPEGTIVLKTTVAHPTALDMSRPVINEVRVLGSRCGPFRPALEALATGTVEVGPMITDTIEFGDAVRALDRASHRDSFKILLEP